jgi:Myb/SANT-like DNA-binding domain
MAYKDRKDKFDDSLMRHDTLWKEITVELLKVGFSATTTQASRKFSKLKSKYMEVVDNTKKTGSKRKDFRYFELFHDMFSKGHNVVPYIASSRYIVPRNTIDLTIDGALEGDQAAQEASTSSATEPNHSRDSANRTQKSPSEDQEEEIDVTSLFFRQKRGRQTAKDMISEKLDTMIKEKKTRHAESQCQKAEVLEIEKQKVEQMKQLVDVFKVMLDKM